MSLEYVVGANLEKYTKTCYGGFDSLDSQKIYLPGQNVFTQSIAHCVISIYIFQNMYVIICSILDMFICNLK